MSNYLVVTTPFAAYRIGQRITDAGVMAAILASTDIVFVVPVKLPTPPISCAYPLNATVPQLNSFGFDTQLALSNNDQTGTYTIVGDLGADLSAAATTDLTVLQKLDFTTGKTAIEFGVTVPASLVTNPSVMTISAELITADQAHKVLIGVGNHSADGLFRLLIAIDNTFVYAQNDLVSPPSKVALVIDASDNTLTVFADDVQLTLSSNTVTPAQYIVLLQCAEAAGMSPDDAGKIYSITALTSAFDITTALPTGTKDGCGNVIP